MQCLIFEGDIEELVRLYSGSRSLAKQYLQDKLLTDDEKEVVSIYFKNYLLRYCRNFKHKYMKY